MKTYEEYKESGEDWIGDIPKAWIDTKLKYYADVVTGNTPSMKFENFYSSSKGIPWVKPNDLNEFTPITKSKQFLTEEGSFEARIVREGSILIGGIGDIGKLGVAGTDITTNQQIHSVEGNLNKIDDDFLKYLIYNSIDALQKASSSVVLSILTKTKLLDLAIVIPSQKEQTQIAKYLDYKTQIIDALIEKKEQLIKKLQAQHQAIINEAVTKGLNPNAKMKDSGIEWLGEIPEHWFFNKAKRNTYMKGRIGWQGLKQEEFIDEGPYLITGMNFKDGVIRWNEVYHITKERYDEAPEIQLKEGDVLMTKDGTIGKLLFVDNLPGPASLNSHLLVLRCTDDSYIPKYLYYQLMSELFLVHVELYKTGTTFFGITQESVGKYQMLLPPIEEQAKIVKFLEENLNTISLVFDKIKDQIKKLKSYRESIISEAVTGKVDVRDWQAPSEN